jgi:hypothetical protein
MSQEKIVLELPTRMVVLNLTHQDTDLDTDQLINIQYHNIIGEILTFATVFNRIGNLKAEIENVVAEYKLDCKIFEAHMQEKKRKELTCEVKDSKGNPKIDKPTKDEVENAVLISPEYKIKHKHLLMLEKQAKIIDSLYWSAKDKSGKLDAISAKLKPEEFEQEILESTLNGIQILVKHKSIK